MGRMQQCEFTVGLALRRQFRRILRSRGLDFTEEKGWLDSQFIIRGNGDQLRPLFALAVGDPPPADGANPLLVDAARETD